MTGHHLLLAMLILYMGLLSSCGKAENQEEAHVSDTSAAAGMSEGADQTNDSVTAYLEENGRLEGNVYCLNEQLTMMCLPGGSCRKRNLYWSHVMP